MGLRLRGSGAGGARGLLPRRAELEGRKGPRRSSRPPQGGGRGKGRAWPAPGRVPDFAPIWEVRPRRPGVLSRIPPPGPARPREGPAAVGAARFVSPGLRRARRAAAAAAAPRDPRLLPRDVGLGSWEKPDSAARQEKMTQSHVGINRDSGDWEWSSDAGERARLLQSPSAEGPRPAATSLLGAVFIVVNAALGAGLLNFPAAFQMAGGVAAGIAMQLGLLLFIIGGLVILAYCSQASNERTYQEVVWAVCGRVLGVLCEVAIVVYTFGTCIAFLIIIGDQQDKIIPVLIKSCAGEGRSCWFTDRKCTISLTAILFILPLSIPKEIGFQKYASCLSVIGTWYVTVVVIVKYFWPDPGNSPEEITASPSSWVSVFNAMPTICFGFQCHVSSVPIFNSMKCPQVRSWGIVVTAAMVIALFVYMGTGVCGFLTFGESVQQDVLLNYPSDDIPVAFARAFIILSVLTSYPILHFCGRAVLEGLWLRYKGESMDEDLTRERRRRLLQTFCWFLLTLLLALFIPDIGRVISVIGGLAACFIFVFPGLCLIHTKLSEVQGAGGVSWWMVVGYGVFMVVLGSFIFGQTTANAISMDLRK